MTVRWDTTTVDGRSMKIYTAAPSGPSPHPAVVIAHHGPGLDGFIQDIAHRLFRQGYAAAAPDLFHRQPAELAQGVNRSSLLDDREIIADINATVKHLRGLPDATVGRIGIVGFCMGGRVVYMVAGASKDFSAAACFYGGNIFKVWGKGLGPSPFEMTKNIGCPVIGFFGKDDPNPTPADVAKLDAELTKYGKEHKFHTYAGAGHAFQNFLNDQSFRDKAAKDSWEKMMAFFETNLKAKAPVGAR